MAKKSPENPKKTKNQPQPSTPSLNSLLLHPEMSRDALAAHRSMVREIQNITDTIKGIDVELPFMAQAVIEAVKTRMSLREMARRMDVSPTHLCQIGNRKTPCSWPFYKRLVELMTLELHTGSANAPGKQ